MNPLFIIVIVVISGSVLNVSASPENYHDIYDHHHHDYLIHEHHQNNRFDHSHEDHHRRRSRIRTRHSKRQDDNEDEERSEESEESVTEKPKKVPQGRAKSKVNAKKMSPNGRQIHAGTVKAIADASLIKRMDKLNLSLPLSLSSLPKHIIALMGKVKPITKGGKIEKIVKKAPAAPKGRKVGCAAGQSYSVKLDKCAYVKG